MFRFRRMALALVLAATSAFVSLSTPAQASPSPSQWLYLGYYDNDGPGVLAYRTFATNLVPSHVGIEVVIWQNGGKVYGKGAVLDVQYSDYHECGKELEFRVDFVKYVNGHHVSIPFWGVLPTKAYCEGYGWYKDYHGNTHEWQVYPYQAHEE